MNTSNETTRVRKTRPLALFAAAIAAIGALAAGLTAAAPAGAAFPGGNGKIAFAAYDAVSYNIWVMNADGSGRTYLTSSTDWEDDPAFSPDGSKIAYTRGKFTNLNDIWVMNENGTGQTNLTPGPGQEEHAAWSPDGSKIAFESSRDGNWEIYVMNADGSGQTNLTNHAGPDNNPAWSPDGSKIAYSAYPNSNSEIFVMNVDGSAQTNLTQSAAIETDPAWSPDGGKIAYTNISSNNNQVYVMNADGSGPTNVSRNSYSDSYPAWSPDGTKIAFTSWRDGNGEVYVMNADGSAPNNLTQLVDEEAEPTWQTVPSADLALSLVANPETAKAQKPLEYTIRVANVGPSNAAGVVVTDSLPADQRFVSATPSQGSCVTPPVDTVGTVTCNLGFLLRDHDATAEVVVKVLTRKASVTYSATAASATPDPYLANNTATITTPVK